MTLLSLYAAFACCGFILASLATDAFQDIRPRFLREADTLPTRGIVANGVATLPLLKTRASKPAAKAKRQSTVQVPLADQMDGVYVRTLDTRYLEELKDIAGRSLGYWWSNGDFST
jgi:hypothetical protein